MNKWVSHSLGLRRGQKIGIANRFPGGVDSEEIFFEIIAVNGKTHSSLGDHTREGLIEWWSCICLQVVCRKLEKSVFLNSQIHGVSGMVGT